MFNLTMTFFRAETESEATKLFDDNLEFYFENNLLPVWLDPNGVSWFPNVSELNDVPFFWSETFNLPNNLKEFD